MLVLQLVFAVTMLSLIGGPLRILISSRMHLFRGLNLLQIYALDIYLGGVFLFFWRRFLFAFSMKFLYGLSWVLP